MAEDKKFPAEQGKYEVGYKKPPEEHQFPPGQSGNPKGSPVRRTNLWVWFCKYMGMTDVELTKLAEKELTAAQQTALAIVKNSKTGKCTGSQRLARDIFDREEGRATEHIIVDEGDKLSEAECEEIRDLLLRNLSHNHDVK